MTVIAGIYSRNRNHPITDGMRFELEQLLSRNSEDEVLVCRDEKALLMKVDIGAYQEPAVKLGGTGSVSMLAGDPHLAPDAPGDFRTRSQDLDLMTSEWDEGNYGIVAKAQGVFCAVHYLPSEDRLTLISDKLCIRPLYYWVDDRYVAFASALRILEILGLVPKVMDVRGVSEIASLGYPLGIRTPYSNVSLLRAAEILQFSGDSSSNSQYWRWDGVEQLCLPTMVGMKKAYSEFRMAIKRRVRREASAISFLSGGMDSRCIVAILRDMNVNVHTFTFSLERQQDQVFSARFAEKAGTLHTQVTSDVNTPHISLTLQMKMKNVLEDKESYVYRHIDRPQLVWSGDGGSVGLGLVYITSDVVRLLRNGQLKKAIDVFLYQQGSALPRGLFKKERYASMISAFPSIGVLEEIEDIHCKDEAREFHIFLLLNDQRRHLSAHFEDIDLHRLEFHLPFFDSLFLESILEVPLDHCLFHRFYTEWFDLFPTIVKSVPWQTYPGHEPCPLPTPEGLRYQWQPGHFRDLNEKKKQNSLKTASLLLKDKEFPSEFISKTKLRMATWAFRSGMRDYGYVISTARTFQKYWHICDGKYVLD